MLLVISIALAISTVAVVALSIGLRRTRRSAHVLRERVHVLESEQNSGRQAKDRFLASVTHELRTPLTAILGYQELLSDGLYGDVDERLRRPIRQIGSAADSLMQLVDGILELARLDAGRLELNVETASVEHILARVRQGSAAAAAEQGVAVEVKDPPAPVPRITSDSDRLQHALSLVVLAAVRTTRRPAVTIDAAAEHDLVVFRIRGGGLALNAHSPERTLGGFEDAPNGSEPLGRTGLRLSIAKRLIERLGGELTLVADEDGATTVVIRISDAPVLVEAAA